MMVVMMMMMMMMITTVHFVSSALWSLQLTTCLPSRDPDSLLSDLPAETFPLDTIT